MKLTAALAACGLPLISYATAARPIVTAFTGVAILNPSHSQTYVSTDDNQFIYHEQNSNDVAGVFGVAVGKEYALPTNFLVQASLQYTLWTNVSIDANHSVGITPNTSTLYDYHYRLTGRQLLLTAKGLTTVKKIFHPYIMLGMGPAFNTMYDYDFTTNESGSLNATPAFSDNTQASFSYAAGLGMDSDVNEHVRLGIGYQFSDLGNTSLVDGKIHVGSAALAAPFTLTLPHVYVNQVNVQLSYIF